MKIDLYTQTGEKNGTIDLPKEIFEVPFNEDLIHQALKRQLANARIPTAHTKKRDEVSGGGRKPHRQKGTGMARQGSTRSPHMRGGGVVFGPTNKRNFKTDMPKKQRRKALFSALSEKARNNEIMALEGYETSELKTKQFAQMLKKMPIEREVLIVTAIKNETIQKSGRNLPNVKIITANYINIHDLQRHKNILFLKDAVDKLKEVFLTKKAKQ
ncbi:MAG: 50S ribosomal protein L4 [Candidatus Peregrinibacteria bacterium]